MSAHKIHPLPRLIERHRAGESVGVCCLCTINPFVLETAMARLRNREGLLFLESTSNQVNQDGGYSGMTPSVFARFVLECAQSVGLDPDRIVLGADHMGPLVWRAQSAAVAMSKACELARACVKAGYTKLHLDATASCADDPTDDEATLPSELVAERTAELCAAAEEAADRLGAPFRPLYVIGSDVPFPGGAMRNLEDVPATSVESVRHTVEATRSAFLVRGLHEAWERVVAVVVQAGVEFGETTVVAYKPEKTEELSRYIESCDGLVYEAHSTDYQTTEALRQMVENHFAILKVGPWLTFAFREAVFALERMEQEWLAWQPKIELSRLGEIIEEVMLENPNHWRGYCSGNEEEMRFARKFGFSDRVRYYWPDGRVQAALNRLLTNLEAYPPPLPLLSFYMPEEYNLVRAGLLPNHPKALIRSRIAAVLAAYDYACQTLANEQTDGECSDENE